MNTNVKSEDTTPKSLLESGRLSVVNDHDVECIISGVGKVEPNGYVNVPPGLLAEWLAAIQAEDWKCASQISGLLNSVAKANLKRKELPIQPEQKKEGENKP
jgi:hypothetical protein